MYCERKKKGEGFIIHFSKEINLSSELQEGVDKMNNEFEKCIMKIPEQYSWEYKKFKRNNKESIY
jgi:lauroyl/myristoyl acyltransferase